MHLRKLHQDVIDDAMTKARAGVDCPADQTAQRGLETQTSGLLSCAETGTVDGGADRQNGKRMIAKALEQATAGIVLKIHRHPAQAFQTGNGWDREQRRTIRIRAGQLCPG